MGSKPRSTQLLRSLPVPDTSQKGTPWGLHPWFPLIPPTRVLRSHPCHSSTITDHRLDRKSVSSRDLSIRGERKRERKVLPTPISPGSPGTPPASTTPAWPWVQPPLRLPRGPRELAHPLPGWYLSPLLCSVLPSLSGCQQQLCLPHLTTATRDQ